MPCKMHCIIFCVFFSIVSFKGLEFKRPLNKTLAEYNIIEEMAKRSVKTSPRIHKSVLRSESPRIETKWFEQPLNHFDPAEKRRFKMKYFVDSSFWVPNGPIYIYITGEGKASGALDSLLLYEVAEDTGGLIIGTEHRYYGDSKPPLNLSVTDNLRYLHSRQALADLARLIEAIKATPNAACSKVVVSGGSYAGVLAAWMRVIYPNLVYAAVSSGAGVIAKKYLPEFIDVVGYDFGKYGLSGCYDMIRKVFNRYARLLKTFKGIEQLKREKNICSDIDMTIPENKQYFFFEHISAFVGSAQLGTKDNMRQNCSDLMKTGKVNPVGNKFVDKECINFRFIDYLNEEYKNLHSRFWLYQVCSEFGYYFTTSEDSPFTNSLPPEYSLKKCAYVFGPNFNEQRIDEGIARTNKMYGGLEPPVTNVLFVNGEADPWSPVTVMKPLPYNPTVIIIPEATHCKDLYYINQHDSPEVATAKLQIIRTVKEWVRKPTEFTELQVCINKNRDDRIINRLQEYNIVN